MKKAVFTPNAPKAVGPYSQAVWAGPLLFCSGQIAIDPKTDQVLTGSVGEQAERVLLNIKALLESQGLGFQNVVKSTIFLVDMGDFGTVNEAYAKYFKEPYPARSTIAVKSLPKGVSVEIEVIVSREA